MLCESFGSGRRGWEEGGAVLGEIRGLRLGQINQFKFDRLIDEFMRERVKS